MQQHVPEREHQGAKNLLVLLADFASERALDLVPDRPYPVAFLAKNHGLAVGVMSYAGQVNIGLIGDFDAMPDIGQVRRGLNESLAELLAAAEEVENSIAPDKPGKASARKGSARKGSPGKATASNGGGPGRAAKKSSPKG